MVRITNDSIMTKIDIEIDLRLGIGLVVITRSLHHEPKSVVKLRGLLLSVKRIGLILVVS